MVVCAQGTLIDFYTSDLFKSLQQRACQGGHACVGLADESSDSSDDDDDVDDDNNSQEEGEEVCPPNCEVQLYDKVCPQVN